MPISLTSQEKKVLGFVALMTVLGLAMLGVQRLAAPETKTEKPSVQVIETKTP